MPQSTILFKSPAVSVLRRPENKDGTLTTGSAVLFIGQQSVLLEAEAAELLVNYLQVIRAYFVSFNHSRKIISGLFEQVIQQLTITQAKTGNALINNNQVSELIRQLGCLDDWRQQYPTQ